MTERSLINKKGIIMNPDKLENSEESLLEKSDEAFEEWLKSVPTKELKGIRVVSNHTGAITGFSRPKEAERFVKIENEIKQREEWGSEK